MYTRSVRVVLGLHWGSTGVAVLLQYCSSSTAAVQQQQYWSDKSLFSLSALFSLSFTLALSRPLLFSLILDLYMPVPQRKLLC